MDLIPEDEYYDQELKVTFQPELYLQRRIWILNMLRKESVTHVLDVGCGEGQLLVPLSQPAPWLAPPPVSILPPPTLIPPPGTPKKDPEQSSSGMRNADEIPNLYISHLHGLDISKHDLEFAARETVPPQLTPEEGAYQSFLHMPQQRWEELEIKLWEGGLEVVNEEFVNIECIVSTEVIEHLPPEVFPAFVPTLLGVYHPRLLLITTPSYTYNARFTAPNAPKSARRGYLDPTGRTERIFRHDDHKFEWTIQEFRTWCEDTAKDWGYEVEMSGVGRSVESDPWNREEELGEASLVACFRKTDLQQDGERESRGRETIRNLSLPDKKHKLHVKHTHLPNPSARKPKSFAEIASAVAQKMDEFRDAFIRLEEIWFWPEVSVACGGWIEFLVRAVEESDELDLIKEEDSRSMWRIQRIGAVTNPAPWPEEGESSLDYIPPEWEPEEEETEESIAADGDVSWNNSDLDTEDEGNHDWSNAFIQLKGNNTGWGWESSDDAEESGLREHSPMTKKHSTAFSGADPNAGWDGDASEVTS
ncbi:Small RNA 2'-O-methyltransferase [Leucoagaricus sp. SymC.cos]|nr:Small RNA 2'-O-methyltransferase [Leucoagaricus sp. SymC.cos]